MLRRVARPALAGEQQGLARHVVERERHTGRGQLDRADEALQSALRINPAYATALENLGDLRVRQAADAYQRARQADGGAAARLAPRIDTLRGLMTPPAKPGG